MRISLKQYCAHPGFNAVSDVRQNSNGYKYVTLANTKTGETENLYLGTRYSDTVTVGARLNIHELYVADTLNAHKEQRFKLTDRSGEISAEKMVHYQTF